MNKVIVHFDGGLGNQMSQYSMAKLLETLYPQKKVYADIRKYQAAQIHNGFELESIFKNIHLKKYRESFHFFKEHSKQIIQEYISGYPIDEEIYHLTNESYHLYGTWHNYDYSEILPLLRKDFMFPQLPLDQQNVANHIASTNSVSVHVRKGDYVRCGLDILSIDWYRNAIELIKNRVSNPVFFIFSDEDIREAFSDIDGVFVQGNRKEKAYIDMQLMSMCKSNIIANSTFSYWAALLNENENKTVIRPAMQTKDRRTWCVKDWILL